MSFFAELKRRNVYRVAAAYAVVAWFLIQLASILFPTFEAPQWVMKVFIALLGFGFPAALVLAWAFEVTPEGIKRTEDIGPNEPPSAAPRSYRGITALIVITALLAGALFVYSRRSESRGNASTDKSIAVLPLVNQSGDPAQEYFSDGLSEELINGLGQIRELRVIGRNSSFHFKNRDADSRAVGQALGVAHLLEGSVRKAGDRVRISVQLVDVADGSQRWSESYDRELKDIFAVQVEIAKSIAAQLRMALLGSEATATGRPSNGNINAYNAYLQGTYHVFSGDLDGLAKAIEFFEEAIRLDPRYADAFAFKALAWSQIGYLNGAKGAGAFEQARHAAKAALAINPNLPRGRGMLAYVHINADWDLKAAEVELGRIPDASLSAPHVMAIVRSSQGRTEEAIELENQALLRDPANATFLSVLGTFYLEGGRYEEAATALKKSLALRPGASGVHFNLVEVALFQNEVELALREAKAEPPGPFHDAANALAQSASGDRGAAEASLAKLIETYGEVAPFRIAGVYAYRKESEQMFAWLDRAYALHDPRLIRLISDPLLRPYRADARFVALAEKLRLPVSK